MVDRPESPATGWPLSPTSKAKNAVQRSVTTLLDELAPERALRRMERVEGSIEQHRTPSGCVLQGTHAAISVSWFAEGVPDAALGELHVVVWRGTVTRPGTRPTRNGARVVAELVLRPVDPPEADCLWTALDGTRFDTAALAAKCLSLLETELKAATASDSDSGSP
jgi:hypothetical protein